MKTRMNPILQTTLVLALGAVLVGCSATSPDRTKRRPHTAMRGPAHKRLILTLNESHNLSLRANQHADALEASGQVDPMTMLDARELAEDAAQFADDVEWSVTNNQRMVWHRTHMDGLWDRFIDLYPEEQDWANAYRTKDMRKAPYKVQLKKAYNEQWDLDFEKVRDQVMERQKKAMLESL